MSKSFLQDLTGLNFGRWIVVRFVPTSGKLAYWRCLCECGEEKLVAGGDLKRGHSTSCGCTARAKTGRIAGAAAGLSSHRDYPVWSGMLARCYNPKATGYSNYGGRGIGVCERWRSSFKNFLDDLGPRPTKEHSIHRPDNDGDYTPDNARWAMSKEQNRCRSNARVITCYGETHNLSWWSELTGMAAETISSRLKRGWSTEEALFTSPGNKVRFGTAS